MAPLIFLLDNYDSFTYNLAQYLLELGARVRVRRNDEVGVGEVMRGGHDGIVISPGPGRPGNAGITPDLVREAAGKVPLLGVCLGHQAIGEVFGGKVVRASRLMHGKTSLITHDSRGVYAGLPNPFEATRYHSLVLDPDSLPDVFEVSATTRDGSQNVIMGIRHREYPDGVVEGVQFHPESILTTRGKQLLFNFVKRASC